MYGRCGFMLDRRGVAVSSHHVDLQERWRRATKIRSHRQRLQRGGRKDVQPLCNRTQTGYGAVMSQEAEVVIGPSAPRTFQLLAQLVERLVLPDEWDEAARRLVAVFLIRYFFNSDTFVECMSHCGSQTFDPDDDPVWGLTKTQLESLRLAIRAERQYFHSKDGDVRWFTHHVPHNRSWANDQRTSKHIGYVRELAEWCLAWCSRIVDSDVDLRPAGRWRGRGERLWMEQDVFESRRPSVDCETSPGPLLAAGQAGR